MRLIRLGGPAWVLGIEIAGHGVWISRYGRHRLHYGVGSCARMGRR